MRCLARLPRPRLLQLKAFEVDSRGAETYASSNILVLTIGASVLTIAEV